MMAKNPKDAAPAWRKMARWPIFLLANLAIVLVLGISTVRETYRGWTADREIAALEAEAQALEGQKTQLESLAAELVSNDRIEYEARARLGQKKPDERVIILQGFSVTPTWNDSARSARVMPEIALRAVKSNPQLWWEYFFQGQTSQP